MRLDVAKFEWTRINLVCIGFNSTVVLHASKLILLSLIYYPLRIEFVDSIQPPLLESTAPSELTSRDK